MNVKAKFLAAVMSLMLLFAASAMAEEKSLLGSVVEGCMTDLETFCKNVTPGQKRLWPVTHVRVIVRQMRVRPF